MENKTFEELLDELIESLKEPFRAITEWFEQFSLWVLNVIADFVAAVLELIGAGYTQVSIMRKKIRKYMEYKKLAVWLVVTKGRK